MNQLFGNLSPTVLRASSLDFPLEGGRVPLTLRVSKCSQFCSYYEHPEATNFNKFQQGHHNSLKSNGLFFRSLALSRFLLCKQGVVGSSPMTWYCQVNKAKPRFSTKHRSPQSLNRRTSPLSNRKKAGLGGVDGERPSDSDDRLGKGSEWDRELRENAESVPLI